MATPVPAPASHGPMLEVNASGCSVAARGPALALPKPALSALRPTSATRRPSKQASKRSRSVFGPAPTSRPDMLTDAETVIMPSLKGSKGTAEGSAAGQRRGGEGRDQAIPGRRPERGRQRAAAGHHHDACPVKRRVRRGCHPDPADTRAAQGAPGTPARYRERYTPGSPPPTLISRLILLAIVCLQAVLSLRLHNTAFEDEATYLYAGHMELEHILHGSPLQGNYASYFSGSPVLYPVRARRWTRSAAWPWPERSAWSRCWASRPCSTP